ncbi:MAG: hypothetical protein H8K04_15695 [Nitrospira sp.]
MRAQKRGVVGYSRKTALLEEAITQMNAGKYGRSSTALKELLALDPQNMEARRLFATLHLRLGSLIPARQAFDSLIHEAFERQDYWLAESLLREYLVAGPRCVPFLEKLGALYQEKGDALEAVAEYGKAVDILIEDPDTENPHHASQLYVKIRELAPASPVAFRLASFFDAQTGELLARQPGNTGDTTAAPPLSSTAESQGGSSMPEPVTGAMPWEVQHSPDAAGFSTVAAASADSRSISDSPAATDDPVDEAFSLVGDASPSAPLLLQSAESRINEVHPEAPNEVSAQEFRIARDGAEISNPSGQGISADSSSSVSPSDSVAEISEIQAGSDPIVSAADPALAHEQDRLQEESQPKTSADAACASMVSALTDSVNAQGSPISTPVDGPHDDDIPAPRVEGVPPSLETGSLPSEPIQPQQTAGLSSPQLIETDSHESLAETPSGTGTSSSQAPASGNESSEPWKQPGFSWASVFNSAWNFGKDDSPKTSQPELTPARAEEATTETPTVSSLQEPLLENPSVEIPEGKREPSLGDKPTSEFTIAPMPWDQVEESVITIPPAQTDEPIAESVEPTLDRLGEVAEQDLIPTAGESQSQPLPPTYPVAETDSSSIGQAPQSLVSPEPDIRAGDVGLAPVQTEGEQSTFVEPEQVAVAETPAMEEPISDTSVSDPIPPMFTDKPIVDNVEVPPEEPYPANPDAPLKIMMEVPTAAPPDPLQESAAEPVAHSLQPSDEITDRETDKIQSSPSVLKEQAAWEPSHEIAVFPPVAKEATENQPRESPPQEAASVEARVPMPEPAPRQEEYVRTEESIRFVEQPSVAPVVHVSPQLSSPEEVGRPMSAAASAVDVLFESSRNVRKAETRERAAEPKPNRKVGSALSRIRAAIVGFVSSCFSTTRAIVTTLVGLVVLSGALVALGIGVVAVTWLIMEEAPSPLYHSLTTTPQRTLSDYKKNGYLLLLGIEAPADQDPVQAGYDRKPGAKRGEMALACFGNSGSKSMEGSNASASVIRGWFRSSDPINQFKSRQETIKGWVGQNQLLLNRYDQWKKLPFEDWGYGQTVTPPCAAMVFAHQLNLADGFVQSTDVGVDRLETDMEAWRIVLGQAKTLPVKMLALQAINDDIAVASGLLVRSDFDGKYLGRVTKFLRPLDQGELSMRWPMQSELVSASRTYDAQLKVERAEEQAVHATVASALPLPKQRRLNDYAEYYEASYKAAGEGRYGSLPKWKEYIHFPASGLMDYFTNPIENVVGLEPLAPWDLYNGFVVDTDAHLRLASLQAWLRRGPADGDLLARMAKAGQNFYDPYTGLPMLVNMKKGVFYSVGHDGKDQDADPQLDVVVGIPAAQSTVPSTKSSTGSSKSR